MIESMGVSSVSTLGVVPVLVGPLQALLAILPALLAALGMGMLSLLRPKGVKTLAIVLWRMRVALLLIAGVVVGGAYLWPAAVGHGASARQADLSQDWAMLRGGLGRTGALAGATGPGAEGMRWEAPGRYFASPALAGGRVYVTTADVASDSGDIRCYDASTGDLLWKRRPAGYRATFSSPAISGRFLMVGEGLHFTDDARVLCLDIADNGKVLWEYRTASHVESTPCIADGKVFVGAGADGYYCFALEGDGAGGAQILWHATGENYPDAETSPVYSDGNVYVGLGVGGQAVCCISASNGNEVWRIPAPYPVFAPPAICNGRLFVGMGVGDFVNDAEALQEARRRELAGAGASEAEIQREVLRLSPAGEVWGVRLDDPTDRWTLKLPRTVLGAIVAIDDDLYFGSRDGRVYHVSQDGKMLGSSDSHEPVFASPAATARWLYAVNAVGWLTCLDRQSLQPVWSQRLAGEGPFFSSPAVGEDCLFVGTASDGLLCLGNPAGERPRPRWAGHLGGPGKGGVAPNAGPLSAEGTKRWSYPVEGADAIRITAPVAVLEERILVPVASGPEAGLVCLTPPEDGQTEPRALWRVPCEQGVIRSPVAGFGRAWFVSGSEGKEGRTLRCVSLEDGAEQWGQPVEPGASGELLLTDDQVLVDEGGKTLASYSLDGDVQWTAVVGSMLETPDVAGPILVIATSEPAVLAALDRRSGAVLWRRELTVTPATGPVIDGDTVYLGSEEGLEARRLADGEALWTAALGAMATRPVLASADRLLCTTTDGAILLLNRASGALLHRANGATKRSGPIEIRGEVLYAARNGLVRLRSENGTFESDTWCEVTREWLGEQTSPAVLADGCVYFATDAYGLVCAGAWDDE
jgi:outer membrane protein assembly factor BamB